MEHYASSWPINCLPDKLIHFPLTTYVINALTITKSLYILMYVEKFGEYDD